MAPIIAPIGSGVKAGKSLKLQIEKIYYDIKVKNSKKGE